MDLSRLRRSVACPFPETRASEKLRVSQKRGFTLEPVRYAPEPPAVSSPPPAGVLLVNLGSPAAATARATRTYLRQFLSDPRVVELPRLRWWLLRNLVILPFRPIRAAPAYRKIWTDNGSPLIVTGRHQASDLEWELSRRIDRPIPVFCGMRYGKPSLAAGLGVLRQRGCRRILVLPLYPQYSAATTASTFDEVFRELETWRQVPEIHTVADYHDHPAYLGALVSSIHQSWEDGGKPMRLLVSFHGLPSRYVEAGDPYEDQCRATANLLKDRLDLDSKNIFTAFQSRFGREEWIGPDTADLLKEWGRKELSKLDVVCPGFSADCLETLEEIDMAGRKIFTKAGGGRFRYIPALNHRPDHIAALAEIVVENLGGWIT
jgi:ferrochelatase